MALKFRRGTTAQKSGSLAFGEPYVNTSLGTLQIGLDTGDVTLASAAGIISGSSQFTSSYDTRYETQGRGIISSSAQIDTLFNIDGLISGSSQLSGTTIPNLSGSFTGSFNGNLSGVAAYASTIATVTTGTTTDTTLYPMFSLNPSPNSYITPTTHPSGSFYYNGVTRKVYGETFVGAIEATNGVVSGSSQVIDILSSLNTYTASNDTTNTTQNSRLDQLSTDSGSQNTRITGLETKATTLQTYTASLETKNSTLATYTASLETKNATLATYTASLETKNATLATYTASLETKNSTLASVTASLLASQTNLNTYTGSLLNAFQVTGSKVNFLGDITIYGTQSVINSQNVQIADNILYLSPTASIDNDLGIVGHYNDGTYRHAGVFMDASDGHAWKVFNGLTDETTAQVDTNGTGFTLAPFKAGAITGTSFSGQILSTNGVVSGSSQIVGSSITTNTVTVGSTAIALGGTATTISGLSSVTSTGFTGALTGNASTATTLQTARTINGTSFNGSADITIPNLVSGSSQITAGSTTNFSTDVKTQLNSNTVISGSSQVQLGSASGNIALSTQTTGNYVASLVAGTNITLSNNSGEGATPTIALTNNAITIAGTSTSLGGAITAEQIRTAIGTVVTGSAQIAFSGVTGTVSNAQLANSTISGISLGSNLATLTIGTGLSGTSYNGSTGVTIANTGVISNVAGTGVTVSGATGAVTISIGQSVATNATPTFGNLTINGTITATGDITAYYTSDRRHKNNIQTIPNALDKVKQLNGVTWEWNDDVNEVTKSTPKTGLIAQEVQAVLPQVVVERENGFLGLDYSKMIGLLVEAIKEQQTQIDELKAQIGSK